MFDLYLLLTAFCDPRGTRRVLSQDQRSPVAAGHVHTDATLCLRLSPLRDSGPARKFHTSSNGPGTGPDRQFDQPLQHSAPARVTFRRSPGDAQRFQILDVDVSPRVRKRFLNLSLVLATAASLSFWWLIDQSGGPVFMLYHPKPFLASATGYIGEMPMLTYPAILLLAAAWQGQRLNFGRFLLAFYVASPQIAWAVLGKRRGTIF